MTGDTILHYKVGEKLGAGGMGEVYRATDTRLGRDVALKFLPSSFQYDPDRKSRFMTEARAASALNSPNIAAIYDIGEHADSIFIVMELVEGELLADKLEKGPLPVRQAVDVAMQVADALDEAGNRGIIHRDIKSANLIITRRGLVKVLDFGLAKHVEMAEPNVDDTLPTLVLPPLETTPGLVLGTVSYMAPEQALGKQVDHRADLFALGVVLYEMLSGRLPFVGDSQTEIIDNLLHREPVPITRGNIAVPAELEKIVQKALAKDPDFRYQRARELYIDLHTVKRTLLDAEHATTSTLQPIDMSSGSLPTGVVAAGSGSTSPRYVENGIAVMTFVNITKSRDDAWIGTGIAETVTSDLRVVPGLSVIGREQIFDLLKNFGITDAGEEAEKFAIQIGRRLGASWIVGGGYQRVGDSIRITARLTEVSTGTLVKSVKIDGQIADIFDLEDKIVRELADGLNIEVESDEVLKAVRGETHSVEAFEHFSRGIMNLRSATTESIDRAISLLEKATQFDENYVAAWAALGAACDVKAAFMGIPDLSKRAIEYQQRAISIDPEFARAHEWLGSAYLTIGEYEEAIAAIERAIELDPNVATAHMSLARAYFIGMGMIDEAVAELERALVLDPQLGYGYLQLGYLYTLQGEYDRAETVCLKAIDLQDRHVSGKVGLQIVGSRTRLGYVYYCLGRYEDALREYKTELDILTTSDHALRDRTEIELYQKMGAAKVRLGETADAARYFDRAEAAFDERLAKGGDDPYTRYYMAVLHSLRGDLDRAISHFEVSMRQLPQLNAYRAKVDPDLDALRADPRFDALVSVD